MRLRNNPQARELLAQYKNYIIDPAGFKSRWHDYFGNDNEIRLEIGSGKGQFIIAQAMANHEINHIAVERSETIALRLIRSMPEGLSNLAVVTMDAEKLEEYLGENDISRLYLNFSDPWPKKRHTKRRLTSDFFLGIYQRIMKDGGLMELKTDNRGFFDYSVERIGMSAFTILGITNDLYSSSLIEGNLPTEYEIKFRNLGTPINKLIAQLDKSKIRSLASGAT